jgi:hypothetical protein
MSVASSVKREAVEVHLMSNGSIERAEPGTEELAPHEPASTPLIHPAPSGSKFPRPEGIADEPAAKPAMKPKAADALLAAIARAADGSKTVRLVG